MKEGSLITPTHALRPFGRRCDDRVRARAAHGKLFVALVVLAIGAALPSGAAALTIDAAAVAFNPKKTDGFAVKGRVTGLSLAGAESVRLDFGGFSQTIPIASFTAKSGKFAFKTAKGVPGIATFTIDTVKGKFAASAKNLTLGPFANPAAFRLVSGGFDECSTLSFTEGKSKLKLASTAPACGFDGAPSADPAAFFVATPTDVRVRVTVRDDLAVDLSSLVLFRLDAGLHPVGGPLCTLFDDGSAAHGDDTAVDGVFSCKVTFAEPERAHIRLAVQASRGGVLVLSPSFFVDAVTPLTDDEITTVMDGQRAAGALWDAALAALGDTKKARKQAVAAILDLPGIANAGITADGASIFIEYENGLRGGLDLDPVAREDPLPLASPPNLQLGSDDHRAAVAGMPIIAYAESAVRAGATAQIAADGPRVGNNKVLIWSPFYKEKLLGEVTDALQPLFEKAACPHFEVTVLKNEECTLASIATFPDYGTVVILTHGAQPHKDGDVAFMSGEKATFFSSWHTHAADLKLERLLVYNGQRSPEKEGYFVFFPSFVLTTIDREFPHSVIFAGACDSAVNKTMASVFFVNNASAWVGFSKTALGPFIKIAGVQFFQHLIDDASSAAGAYAKVPSKSLKDYFRSLGVPPPAPFDKDTETLTSELTLLRGDERVSYPCEPPPPGLVDTVSVNAAPGQHASGTVPLDGHYRMVITGTTHVQLDADFGDSDAIYCYDSSAANSPCAQPGGFPTVNTLAFYLQSGNETPSFSQLEDPIEFGHATMVPPLDTGHRYEFHFTASGGTHLYAAAWFNVNPSTEQYSGNFTIQIFSE
jgi:hypothetical protein